MQHGSGRMSSSGALPRTREAARTSAGSAPVLDGWAAVSGRWSFAISITLGFALGLLLPPVAGNNLAGAAISFGAICIAAVAAYHGLARRNQIEQLQQRLQDE